ncbi:MAG: hypothetical protein Q8O16_01170, partial [Dehalococcoidia bacterium]|nr:hypothetical protein [Dehalococcoidia bacterium]
MSLRTDMEDVQALPDGAAPEIECRKYDEGQWSRSMVAVPREMALTIFINGQELVTTMCTPN